LHAKTCLSSVKTAGALAPGAYTEYVRANGAKSAKPVNAKPTKALEHRWRTQRLREGMLFQQAHIGKKEIWQAGAKQ